MAIGVLGNNFSLCGRVHEEAFESASSRTLEWLVETGLYNANHNTLYSLFLSNELGVRKLVEEGRDPNEEVQRGDGDMDQPLTAHGCSARMVDVASWR